MSKALSTKCELDWTEDVEEMYELQRERFSSGSCVSSESEDFSVLSIFGGRFREAMGGTQSRTVKALDLAVKDDFDEVPETTNFVWPVGWLEISDENYPIVRKWLHTHMLGQTMQGITDPKRVKVPEDTDKPQHRIFHHLNFHNQPELHRNATPPEASLWFTVFAKKCKTKYHSLRQFVITSQAGKLIDQVLYLGLPVLLQLYGTALHDAVIGDVHKVYQPRGTWGLDLYSSDEAAPICARGVGTWIDGTPYSGPPRPYVVQPDDETTPAVNDDGRVHGPSRNTWKPLPGQSKLCNVENAEDDDRMPLTIVMSQGEQQVARALDIVLKARDVAWSLDRETSLKDDEPISPLSSDDGETHAADEDIREELSLVFGRL
ncbi:hypothetical protein MMC30_006980 [Trapelia coarctata]|nr:hypothetical protein [Trapelia coarctata]